MTKIKANYWNLHNLEAAIYPKMYNFKTLEEYYEAIICKGLLNQIKVPTMFLNHLDDPGIDPNIYPKEEFETCNNENIVLALSKRGGHCSSFTGDFLPY